jgi:hypothetical protein
VLAARSSGGRSSQRQALAREAPVEDQAAWRTPLTQLATRAAHAVAQGEGGVAMGLGIGGSRGRCGSGQDDRQSAPVPVR